MKDIPGRGRGRAGINLLLFVLIVALYATLMAPEATSAISELYQSPIYRGHAQGVVALECAVSWNAAALPEILDVLQEQGVCITFFVSGAWAQDNAELLQRMVRDGHEIGTMGQQPSKDGSANALQQDLEDSLRTIQQICGVRPNMYHSGTRDIASSSKAARRAGMLHVLSTVDLLCGRGSAQEMLLRALDKLFDGSIVLMQPTAEAVKALPAMLEGFSQAGFRVGTVGDALGEYRKKEVHV